MAHDHVGERRLAGAVRAHQGVHFPLLDVEVEAFEDLLVLDLHVQVAYLQLSQFHSVSGFSSLRTAGRRSYAALPSAAARVGSLLVEKSTSSARVVPARALVTPP